MDDYRVGELGPRLFEFRLSRFARHYYGEPWFQTLEKFREDYDAYDPPDPPPFLLSILPDYVREQVLAEGMHGDTFEMLAAMGVDRLQWRQKVLHLEEELISDDVFQALNDIAPRAFESTARFQIPIGGLKRRTYHKWKTRQYPPFDRKLNVNRADGRPTVIAGLCEPPLPPDMRVSQATKLTSTVLAYPLWMAHDDRILALVGTRGVVTEGFVEAWRATDISKHLRDAHWEHDIEFTPSSGASGRVKYRWVDVPEE